MDPTRSAHATQTPASASTLATTMSPFVPPSDLATTVPQPPNPFGIPSNSNQPFAAPLQSTSVGAAQTLSQGQQPLAQALNASGTSGLPVATQGISPDNIARSETAPAAQSGTDIYPHQIDGLGGPTATAPFLQDFNLVAEAAKRAQMGIVMRDLESVTL